MNLYRKRLSFAFFLSLLGILFIPPLFPSLQLVFFAPFLTILYYKKDLLGCLWGSLFCGLILDLLSAESRLGLYAINYMLVTMIIYRLKYNFFSDSVTTLPLLTFLFSLVSTILEIVMMIIFDYPLSLKGNWLIHSIFVTPMFSAMYSLIYLVPDVISKRARMRARL